MTLSQSDIDSLVGGDAAEPITAPPAAAPQCSASPAADIERILRLSIPLSVTLADRDMPIDSILALTVGSIIEFEMSFDADLTLSVGNHAIGRGHAVKAGENFGLRVTEIGTLHERIDAMRAD